MNIIEARLAVHRALDGADLGLAWREAGYRSPTAAARALLGDRCGMTSEAYAIAVAFLAEEIR